MGEFLICVDRIKVELINKTNWGDLNLRPTVGIEWASNSGEEKDSLGHSATGHYM